MTCHVSLVSLPCSQFPTSPLRLLAPVDFNLTEYPVSKSETFPATVLSRTLYRVSADVGGPALIKRISQRSRKAVEAMLQTAPDTKSPPDKFAIDIMLAAMAGAIRSFLEAEPSPSAVRKSREQLVLLCQSYMAAATAKHFEGFKGSFK